MIAEQLQKQLTELSPSKEKTIQPNYDYPEVTLTEEETVEALRMGREKKYYNLQRDEYWNKISIATTLQRPNARELYEYLRNTKSQSGKPFEIVDWNKHVIFSLCLYFAGDPKFETMGEGFSLTKGICITGAPGTGKTHLMNFFARNPLQSYRCVTTKLIGEQYANKWSSSDKDALQFYSSNSKPSTDHPGNLWGQQDLGFCFGDLGTESTRKQFGNETNVMEHIIFQRYENQLAFNTTHFTSNLNADEIGEMYGERVRDRIREMCNFIVLDGPSWRK